MHSFICGCLSSAFSTASFGCALWHEVQATWRLSWLEPIQCFWLPLLWHSMQTPEDSTELRLGKVRIFVLSPAFSTWAWPGPWQPSQPSGDAMCGVALNFVATSSWHWTHMSMPTNPGGAGGASTGVAGAAGGAVACAPPALAKASRLMSPAHAAVRAHPVLRISVPPGPVRVPVRATWRALTACCLGKGSCAAARRRHGRSGDGRRASPGTASGPRAPSVSPCSGTPRAAWRLPLGS